MYGIKLTTAERSTIYGGTLLEHCSGVCKYYAPNIYVYKLVKLADMLTIILKLFRE